MSSRQGLSSRSSLPSTRTRITAELPKKIPSVSAKYKNVKPVVDSGASLRKHLEHIAETRKYVKQKKDEIFKRIKLRTFVTLMIEVAKESLQFPTVQEHSELGATFGSSPSPSELDSILASPSVETEAQFQLPQYQKPYLLLDVRSLEDYRQCHIITAQNYPYTMISRACNYETKDLLAYKNDMSKIIVCYDEDELLASRVVTVLFQRGYDNIFLLSGGLKLAAVKFPQGLIVGTLPPSCQPQPKKVPRMMDRARSQSSFSLSSPEPLRTQSAASDGTISSLSYLPIDEQLSNDAIELLETQLNRLTLSSSQGSVATVATSSKTSRTPIPSTSQHQRTSRTPSVATKPKPWK